MYAGDNMRDIRKHEGKVSLKRNELVEGSHLFQVKCYWLLLERNCSCLVQSSPFKVGEHKWIISFYTQYYKEHASVYLSDQQDNTILLLLTQSVCSIDLMRKL